MDRSIALDILSNVSIASPCNVPWDSMKGDNRVRFCDECHLRVYNLSDMKAVDAADLVQRSEGRLCIKFYQRADGTMLTTDCPKGIRPKIRWAASRIAAAIMVIFGISLSASGCATTGERCYTGVPLRDKNASKPGNMSLKMGMPPPVRRQSTTQPADGQLERLR